MIRPQRTGDWHEALIRYLYAGGEQLANQGQKGSSSSVGVSTGRHAGQGLFTLSGFVKGREVRAYLTKLVCDHFCYWCNSS